MLAKVRSDCRWSTVTAFAGREYVKREWRRVPDGCEEEAQRHSMLDAKDDVLDVKDANAALDMEALLSKARAANIPHYWSMSRTTLEEKLETNRTD